MNTIEKLLKEKEQLLDALIGMTKIIEDEDINFYNKHIEVINNAINTIKKVIK